MERDVEETKRKILEKLPEILPKLIKSGIVHIVMIIYHVSMPPWVTAIKVKKAMNNKNNSERETIQSRRLKRREIRRARRR